MKLDDIRRGKSLSSVFRFTSYKKTSHFEVEVHFQLGIIDVDSVELDFSLVSISIINAASL